jgi:hypothetical protein
MAALSTRRRWLKTDRVQVEGFRMWNRFQSSSGARTRAAIARLGATGVTRIPPAGFGDVTPEAVALEVAELQM